MKLIPKEIIVKLNFNIDALRFHLICLNELTLTEDESKYHVKTLLRKVENFTEITNELKTFL